MKEFIRILLREGLFNNNYDVDFVYNQHPILNNIGPKEQYLNYLKTIFPNSKVKGIFYHTSPNKFTEFKDPSTSGLSHIWFSQEPLIYHSFGSNVYSVLLNIKNPLSEEDDDYGSEIRKYENPLNPGWRNNYDELPNFKYDGTIRSSRVSSGEDVTVRNPKQIHILGSKEDVEGFKKFVQK